MSTHPSPSCGKYNGFDCFFVFFNTIVANKLRKNKKKVISNVSRSLSKLKGRIDIAYMTFLKDKLLDHNDCK